MRELDSSRGGSRRAAGNSFGKSVSLLSRDHHGRLELDPLPGSVYRNVAGNTSVFTYLEEPRNTLGVFATIADSYSDSPESRRCWRESVIHAKIRGWTGNLAPAGLTGAPAGACARKPRWCGRRPAARRLHRMLLALGSLRSPNRNLVVAEGHPDCLSRAARLGRGRR